MNLFEDKPRKQILNAFGKSLKAKASLRSLDILFPFHVQAFC